MLIEAHTDRPTDAPPLAAGVRESLPPREKSSWPTQRAHCSNASSAADDSADRTPRAPQWHLALLRPRGAQGVAFPIAGAFKTVAATHDVLQSLSANNSPG